ncbi:response regulator [Thermodesulfobacteriota bacterium]
MAEERIRMLMVEDDKVDQMAFERMVRSEGLPYDYTCVSSVAAGKKALKENSFDVVVTDYRLGDGTGFDMLAEVPSEIPAILITGAGGEEVAVKAMKAGASDYMTKDVGGSYLKTLPITVGNTIKAKATERELKRYHEELEKLVEERTLQLQQINEELSQENQERKKAEEALRMAHDKLELRVEKRTAELRKTNEQLVEQIAERERAEASLQKSKETMETVLNATDDCAFMLGTDGTFVTLNQTTADTFEQALDELVGQSYFDLAPPELAGLRKKKFAEVVRSGSAIRFEERGTDQIIDHRYHPVFDSDGSVERVAVFSRDVTEQKKAQESSVQQQRLAALGEMAGGVAHNFNNILQIVVGASGLAESDLEAGDYDEVRSTLSQIAESAQLGSETVKQLQDFARVRTEDPTVDGKVFDLSDTVNKAIEVSRPLWKTGPEKKGIKIKLKSNLSKRCFVKGQQNELFEVIVNLVKNATEALPKGGKIFAKTFVQDSQTFLQLGDNGMGIAKRNLNKVFEPFWTTKGFQGTGMGLSTSFGIISRHGGLISVRSKEGKGTVFTVRLPFVGESGISSRSTTGGRPDFQARILIVNDQPREANLLEKGLKVYGQTVFKALSGKEAIHFVRQTQIDLVICDLGMEAMDGWQVGMAIKEVCHKTGIPKTPFILLSGRSGLLKDTEKIAKCGVNRIVEKPFRYPALFETIRQLYMQHRTAEQ